MHKLAKGLLKYETLTGDEIKDLIKGKKIKKFVEKNKKNKKSKILSPVPNVEKKRESKGLNDPQLESN